jgi:glucoamylase
MARLRLQRWRLRQRRLRQGCWWLVAWATFWTAWPAGARAETLDQWVPSERATAARKMLGAIGRNGAVVASPDESTPNQNYYFHWIRDGALTMNVVVTLYEHAPDAEDRAEYFELLKNYAAFSRTNQTASQPGDLTGLGEPKFYVTGTAFTDPWGRPQNDGPALRAIVMCRWGNLLLNETPPNPEVDATYKAMVKEDLAYVRDKWADSCTDLWEEIAGKHFYTRMVQRRALVEGADFLDRIGEHGDATACRAQLTALESAIENHFDPTKSYIVATLDPNRSNKPSQLDTAVILGVLHGETPSRPFFSPTDERVLATATKIHDAFAAMYGINQPANSTDGDGQAMEAAIGRYPEDVYSGAAYNEGNPWFLATAAFAELAYRVRDLLTAAGSVAVTAKNRPYLLAALAAGGSGANIAVGEAVSAGDPRFAAITAGLKVEGDRYLRRIRRHAAADGSLSEQFKGSSGYMSGAVDLTWSYAALVTAIDRR